MMNRKVKKRWFILLGILALFCISLWVYVNAHRYYPIDVKTIESIELQVNDMPDNMELHLTTLQKPESFESVCSFEEFIYKSKGVKPFANAITWKVCISYHLTNGKTISRKYIGYTNSREILDFLYTIPELTGKIIQET